MPFATGQELTITQVSAQLWRLEVELAYFNSRHTDETIIVPVGFTCDGSSIPSLVWPIVGHPLLGNSAICGFLHDYLYRIKFDRKKADLIFYEAHTDLGTPLWKRQIYYRAVRMFGWIPYGKK